ncbi:MAG: carbon-nitrogen hydrolase family protein [Mariprofundaceae bacterium]|nr:carbon-nitrogen hydrolase family protein [Mariprofundaceae bacterium]
MHSDVRVACLQLTSSEDVQENLVKIRHILQEYGKKDLDLLLLPENVTLLTQNKSKKHVAAQQDAVQRLYDFFADIAKTWQMYVVVGSLLLQCEAKDAPEQPQKNQNKPDSDRYYNRCVVFSPQGELLTAYDKIHLFDVDLGSESWLESAQTQAGKKAESFEMLAGWQVGLSICYDLRFPELYRYYSQMGCHILTVPAAFTLPTGQAHWQTLLQARAIENQCYVLAAGQWGKHQDGRETYGHSLIIDPWGEVLAELPKGEGLLVTNLSAEKLTSLRQRMPVLQHRRLK